MSYPRQNNQAYYSQLNQRITMRNKLETLKRIRKETHRYERDLIMMMSANPHEKKGPTEEANNAPSVVALDKKIELLEKLITTIKG